jgi:hypothetical protein
MERHDKQLNAEERGVIFAENRREGDKPSQEPCAPHAHAPLSKNGSLGFLWSWLTFRAFCSPVNPVWFHALNRARDILIDGI